MQRKRGFTLVELMIVIAIIAILAALATPDLIAARKNANETGAIGGLRALSTAETIFREGDKEHDGNTDYGMLSELSNTTLVDSIIGKGTKQGYYFTASYSNTTSEFFWFALANPILPRLSGDRYFVTNVAGVIFYTSDRNLNVDTSTCKLPVAGLTPTGGR